MVTDPSTCPTSSLPENLPIPNNVTYSVIPGTNASAPWMVNCCSPNPVHVVETCYLWCEMTEDMSSFQVKDPDHHTDDVGAAFGSCLTANNRPVNESRITGTIARSSAGRVRRAEAGSLIVVALVALVYLGGHVAFFGLID